MNNLNEEEKKAIENAKEYVENEEILSISPFDIIILLKTIDKQRKEAEDLKDVQQQICNEELLKKEYVQNNYISKDKILKALGYEENSEEYKKLKQDEEKLLAVIDTVYSEFCRLEDIEDQKVSVEVAFIEEKRDKYWQDKIREKIEEKEKQKEEAPHEIDFRAFYRISDLKEVEIGVLKELLEE